LVQDGHEVFGLRRQASDESELLQAGIRPLYADISNRTQVMQLPGDFDWVVNCAASKGGDLLDYRQTYLEGTRNLLEWMTGSRVAKYIYTSSTSVYGQNDGSLVSEA